MTSVEVKLTSEDYWIGALVTALIAAVMALLLAWRIKPSRFRQLTWALAGASAIFWSVFGTAMLLFFWDPYYSHFYSGWMRWLAPLNALLYGVIGLALWWLSVRLPGNTIVNFCLLGGLESIPEHLWGIYGLDVLDKVPLLQGVSPASVLAFAVPEYVLYWGIVLCLAALLQYGWQRWTHFQQKRAKASQ
jgi:multisubunit Na+/H+ antiporter MnhB subunit